VTVSIAIENVQKSFGNKTVLDQVNLTINTSQIYGFIGPSGAGKTTLVKMIVGMDSPGTGTIHVLNKKVPNLKCFRKSDIWPNRMLYI
jgi:ABC-2 type transport system ATP-binding protein